jgi:hypothetical protein
MLGIVRYKAASRSQENHRTMAAFRAAWSYVNLRVRRVVVRDVITMLEDRRALYSQLYGRTRATSYNRCSKCAMN